jgi:hypothetical protein
MEKEDKEDRLDKSRDRKTYMFDERFIDSVLNMD